jgi:hypothetical protein
MAHQQPLLKLQESLEDAFFQEQERKILEKRRVQHQLEETKQNLTAASGIRNEAILHKLIALKVHPETLASLALVPLVEVAWCDGSITDPERVTILEASQQAAARQPDLDHELLKQWLTHRPAPELFTAWEAYVHGLCELLTPAEIRALRDEILDHARRIAGASGGLLGIGAVSAAEKAVLARVETAFTS